MAKASKSIKLPRKTTSALIVDSMRERLMNHEFNESEMIRQDRLAKEYNVSLSPVREALIQLEAEGLLTLVRHHGYAPTTLSTDDIQQLYEMRALIEVELIKHAIPRLTEADIATAKQLHEAMKKIYKRGTQTTAWTKINWQFHTTLYRPAEKRQLSAVIENVYQNINRYVHMQLKLRSSVDLARNIKEHGELLEYCEAREIDKAAQLVRGHVIHASSDLIGFLRESRPESR
ncbi:MAG TPA: GntR family transcriptional regulator [Steroidobacteraceae bacterium]|nr:GntR family transcriptional regulator [Steroidobacteraceae bacterium]